MNTNNQFLKLEAELMNSVLGEIEMPPTPGQAKLSCVAVSCNA